MLIGAKAYVSEGWIDAQRYRCFRSSNVPRAFYNICAWGIRMP